MKYISITPCMDGGVALHYSMFVVCSACGAKLGRERDVKGVKYCPSCGRKLNRIPMNVSSERIIRVLNRDEDTLREEGGK